MLSVNMHEWEKHKAGNDCLWKRREAKQDSSEHSSIFPSKKNCSEISPSDNRDTD